MKFNQLKNTFLAGELSEFLVGRVDLEEYKDGCQTMDNFLPLKQGGTEFRRGTASQLSVATGASPQNSWRLIPFSTRGDSTSLVPIVFDMLGAKAHVVAPGVSLTDTSTFPGTSSDTFLHYAQQNDIMVVTFSSGTEAPLVIARTAPNTYVIQDFLTFLTVLQDPIKQLAVRVPYEDKHLGSTTLTPSAASGTITITASGSLWTTNDVSRRVRITHAGVTGVARITAYTSPTIVTAVVLINFGAATASANWERSEWRLNNWPTSVCFFEQRLIFSGSPAKPDTVWLSEQGDIFQFMQTRLAQDSSADVSGINFFGSPLVTDPFSFAIASDKGPVISFVKGEETLYVGSQTGIYSITGGQEQSLSIASLFIKKLSPVSCGRCQPASVNTGFVFSSLDGKYIYEMPMDSTYPIEASILFNEKLFEQSVTPTIKSLSFNPGTKVLSVLTPTGLFGLAYDRSIKLSAWFRQTPSAKTITNTGYTVFTIDTCFTLSDDGQDYPWVLVERDYGAVSEVSLEYFTNSTTQPAQQGVDWHLDRGVALLSATSNFASTGFPVGTKVIAQQGATIFGELTVAGDGSITLPSTHTTSSFVIFGFKYNGVIKTMPFEAGQTFGQAQGLPRRVDRVIFRVRRSRGGMYYAASTNSFPLVTGPYASPILNSTASFTGEFERALNASPHDVTLTIEQNDPYPLHILWIMLRGVTYDG